VVVNKVERWRFSFVDFLLLTRNVDTSKRAIERNGSAVGQSKKGKATRCQTTSFFRCLLYYGTRLYYLGTAAGVETGLGLAGSGWRMGGWLKTSNRKRIGGVC
jgi:hypothetical protein